MKKKILAVLLTTAMAATLLAGCGGDSNTGDTSNTDTAQESTTEEKEPASDAADAGDAGDAGDAADASDETDAATPAPAGEASSDPADHDTAKMQGKKVGFTVPSVGNDFMKALSEAVAAELNKYGVECQVDSCDGSETTQIEQIENYTQMGMDMIVVFAVNGESLTSVCQRAMDEGIPVLAFAMEIPNGSTTEMISAEEKDMGGACAQMVSDWIDATFPDAGKGEVKVYHMRYSGTPESTERSDVQATLADINKKVTIITEDVDDWNSTDDARNRAENAFLANPDISVIMAVNATTGLGAESYIASSDCPVEDLSKFGIFAVDETEEVVSKIKASANNESTLRGTISMGAISDTVNDFMKGEFPILCEETPLPRIDGAAITLTVDTLK